MHTVPHVRAGVAVFLTNDGAYWRKPSRRAVVDAEFRLHKGRQLSGEMGWSERASLGTKAGRETPIFVSGKYPLEWQEYSSVGEGRHTRFRYLAIRVVDVSLRR